MDIQEDEAYHSGLGLSSEESVSKNPRSLEPSDNARSSPTSAASDTTSAMVLKTMNSVPKPSTSYKGLDMQLSSTSHTKRAKTKTLPTPQSIETPTTNLASRLDSFNLISKRIGLESHTSESPLMSTESPTSDYASGQFPSLADSDRGYASMTSMERVEQVQESGEGGTTSLKPLDTSKTIVTKDNEAESMDVDVVTTPTGDEAIGMSMTKDTTHRAPGGRGNGKLSTVREETRSAEKPVSETSSTGSFKSKSPSPAPSSLSTQSRHRSESPSVPSIGESVEVTTDLSIAYMQRELSRPEGLTANKRSASSEEFMGIEYGRSSNKSRRLDTSQRAIRVPTIVSPAFGGRLSPRPKKTRPRGDRDSHSPAPLTTTSSTAMDTSHSDRVFHLGGMISTSTHLPQQQQQQQQQQPRVNFRDIQDMSKSDKPVSFGERPVLLGVRDGVREGEDAVSDRIGTVTTNDVAFTDRRSPKPVSSPAPAAGSPITLLGRPTQRRHTPSPGRSPAHTPKRSSDSKKDEDKTKSTTGEGEGRGAGSTTDGPPPVRQNALLQVSEAHLAILPDEDGDTPLHLAVIHENFGLTQYLVKLIVGVNMNLDIANNMRQTPLHLAVITRQPHMVKLLVEGGSSVNFPDRKGNTALHLAACRRDTRILQILSQATSPLPDFNAKNFIGLTPAHVATKEASIDVLKFLFQMGANKNAPDACSGRTPLHYAVEQENFILVNFLLESNCNVNVLTFAGNTPLHVAAGRRLKEIVALLMAYGANPAIANGEGDFPSDLPAALLMQRAKMNAH